MSGRAHLLTHMLAVALAGPGVAGQLTNADFESPGGWQLPAAGDQACRIVNDDGRSGSHSVRFKLDAPAVVPPVSQAFACRPNQEYVLAAAFKAAGELRPLVRVTVPGDERKVNVQLKADAKPAWHSKRVRFNSGAHTQLLVTVWADAAATRKEPSAAGAAWVDDVDVLLPSEVPAGESVAGGFVGKSPGPNIALGKPYTLSMPPKYKFCADPGDTTQLTDGEYSVGYFWVQKSTVGWKKGGVVSITVDLGKVEPIAGVSYSTAAGTAGVGWPSLIIVLTSEDGKDFRTAGELIELSSEHGLPAPARYSTHRFVTDKLRTKGRYVRFTVKAGGGYTFCDEIEVYRGRDGWLREPMAGGAMGDMKQFAVTSGMKQRLRRDLAAMARAVGEAKLSAPTEKQLLARLAGLKEKISAVPAITDARFRAIVPMNGVHAEIIKVNAALLRGRGLEPITLWHKNRWDMLDPTEAPNAAPGPLKLEVAMMDNEYRAEAFNLTNATDQSAQAGLRIVGLPGGDNPDYVTVHQVEFVDTQEKVVIADALPVADKVGDAWQITIPAGMTRQVWLTFNPRGTSAGQHAGKVVVDAGRLGTHEVGLTLRLFPFRFPDQPTCSLGVWDYTDGKGSRDITAGNRLAAIANMRAHFVDTPWAGSGTAPRVEPKDLDKQGNLTGQLSFERFDQWVADWAGARHYAVFLHRGGQFAGAKQGSPRFHRAVSQWAAAWAKHNAEIGLRPGQLMVLIVDEPHSAAAETRILDWARPIKEGTSDITIWEDPVHHAPWNAETPEMFDVCDVLCPNLPRYIAGRVRAKEFYESHRQRGAKLWLYQCSGPARLHDPYYYHRLQHWHCWKAGAVGSGFWAYGDAAGASPWCEYTATRTSYAPVYLDEDSITDGKHWEAVREGIEDYEYLRMLRDRVEALTETGRPGAALARARRLLKELPGQVATYEAGRIRWVSPKDRSGADTARVQILEALDALGRRGAAGKVRVDTPERGG